MPATVLALNAVADFGTQKLSIHQKG